MLCLVAATSLMYESRYQNANENIELNAYILQDSCGPLYIV